MCDETAAILFTSGSTGPAKGVVYEHGMFDAQVQAIQGCYDIRPGEVDLPTFPLFALFSVAMGMTSVIPDMDPSHPARVDPLNIVEPIRDNHATNTFGSPALWARVAEYCVDRGIRLPSLRRILIAGAPVPYRLVEMLHRVINPEADVHTPYGATESLPVASISGREVHSDCTARTRVGAGICVGKPLPGIDLRIIRITDESIGTWPEELVVPAGEVGEIVVSGPVVTNEYFGLPAATTAAKIGDGDRLWHRMGDVGYRDAHGRIWFCGRKAHRVTTGQGTMYSVRCEAVFNEHPDVLRSALVGVGPPGRQIPVMVVEPEGGRLPSRSRQEAIRDELLQLARANDLTRSIETILFHRRFPVDVRHNAKINREALAAWAARRLR
jgi:acyl-coenzyme A synthetase/AMP-(fatty) acid ligase